MREQSYDVRVPDYSQDFANVFKCSFGSFVTEGSACMCVYEKAGSRNGLQYLEIHGRL